MPKPGEVGEVYVTSDTGRAYRWDNVSYVEIETGIVLGETATTAYPGDKGKIAYDHSQTTGNPHGTTQSDVGLGNVNNTSDANKPVSTLQQTALNGKVDTLTPSKIIYVDCNRSGYTPTGTIDKPYFSLSAAAATITSDTSIVMAPGTYTENSSVTFPNYDIVIYGNNSILNVTGDIIINTPEFVRYNLFTTVTGTMTFNNFTAGARCMVQGGSITGNVTVNSYQKTP